MNREAIIQDLGQESRNLPRGEEIGLRPISDQPLYHPHFGEPTDRLGRPLADHLYEIFGKGDRLRRLVQQLRDLTHQMGELSQHAAGRFLDYAAMKGLLEQVQSALADAAPYCVCPSCGGVGSRRTRREIPCPTCLSADFITCGDFKDLNTDLQKIAEGYRGAFFMRPRMAGGIPAGA